MSLKITSAYSPSLPTSKKVILLSAGRGCRANCQFCKYDNHKYRGNTTTAELAQECRLALESDPTAHHTKRLEVYFTKLGEPTVNDSILDFAEFQLKSLAKDYLKNAILSPVVATMLPKEYPFLEEFLGDWCYLKNHIFFGSANLQFSLYSTMDYQRTIAFNNGALYIERIANILYRLPLPLGEKYSLNFYADGQTKLRASLVERLFDPAKCSISVVLAQKSDKLKNYHRYYNFACSLSNRDYDVTLVEPSDAPSLLYQNAVILHS